MTQVAFICLLLGFAACEIVVESSLSTSPAFEDISEVLSKEDLEQICKLYKTLIEEEKKEEEKNV